MLLPKHVYMSLAYWFVLILIPVGWSVWRRHIHLSSKYSRWAFDFSRPLCNINTSISPSEWFLWKCSASSELSGLFFMSYRCLENLSQSLSPVWPTQIRLCFLHKAAYITPFVRQSPPSFWSIVIFFVIFVIWLAVEIFWHNLQTHRFRCILKRALKALKGHLGPWAPWAPWVHGPIGP